MRRNGHVRPALLPAAPGRHPLSEKVAASRALVGAPADHLRVAASPVRPIVVAAGKGTEWTSGSADVSRLSPGPAGGSAVRSRGDWRLRDAE